MSEFQAAGAAEILRSSQKDEEYMHIIRRLISDILQSFIGIPYRVKWQNFINTFSDLLFYSLTTLSGFQTLGEEYVNIVQVDSSLKKIPPRWKRLLDILLQTIGCYFVLRFQRLVDNQATVLAAVSDKFGRQSREAALVSHLPALSKSISVLQRLHLIAFYFHGSYYTMSKRLSGIRYVVIRRWLGLDSWQRSFRVLGCLAASQLCLGLVVAFYSWRLSDALSSIANNAIKRDDGVSSVCPRVQCALCLEARCRATVTPCGHLFCWSCITSWMQSKEECPLCREVFVPSKLICLQNY